MNRNRHLVKLGLALVVGIFAFIQPSTMVPVSRGMSQDQSTVTLDSIRQNIFIPTCASTSCHNSMSPKAGLALDGRNAYANLVVVPAQNEAAAAAGKQLVVPGRPEQSFLYQKLTGNLTPDEGDQMPQTGVPLPPEQVEAVRQWILRGALPSSLDDIQLPVPVPGAQCVVPPFQVPVGTEVQGNYYTTLSNPNEMRVTRFEILYPPGSHHLNFFSFQGGIEPPEDGTWQPTFDAVPFAYWALRAGNQKIHLIWDLPPGVAFRFAPHQKVLAQIHFVNIGPQSTPIGGKGVVNLHAAYNPATAPITMGTMFGQNVQVELPPHSTTSWDFGVTFDQFGITEPVKLAAANGHFHWRGKTFEIRLWDGKNKNGIGSAIPGSPAPGEFDRMGVQNRIYRSDNWDEPPFATFPDGKIVIPPGSGIVYRCTFVNNSDDTISFGPHVETQEHANVFVYFYPGPTSGATLAFPLPFQR